MCHGWAFIVWTALALSASEAEFTPKFADAVLKRGESTFRRTFMRPAYEHEFQLGDHRLAVKADIVNELNADGQVLAAVKSDDGSDLVWLGAAANRAYFAAVRPADQKLIGTEIRRLDVKNRKWLAPWHLPNDVTVATRQTETVASLCAADKSVTLLSIVSEESQDEIAGLARRRAAKAYRVTHWNLDDDKPRWSKKFGWSGDRPEPPAYLLSWRGLHMDGNDIRPLTVDASSILVCAGEKQDLVCLDHEGEIVWRVPRIWEYERGFIGPSVWDHYIDRFGVDPWLQPYLNGEPIVDDDKPTPEERARRQDERDRVLAVRKNFNSQVEAWIVAGPVLSGTGPSLFVAVAKARKGDWPAQVADCFVYELDDGQVVAMTSVPRPIAGYPIPVGEGDLIWSDEQGGLVRVGHAMSDFSHGFIMSDDPTCPVRWYRAARARSHHNAWFRNDPTPGTACHSRELLLRTLLGGYVASKEDTSIRFPIQTTDLVDGLEGQELELVVPFAGVVPWPEKGYSKFGDAAVYAHGPYLITISSMQLDGSVLEITISTENTRLRFGFNIAAVVDSVTYRRNRAAF